MSIRTGLAAQIGIGDETTYGTYAPPTRFTEFADESMKLDLEYAEAPGMRATNRVQRTDRVRANKKGASGDVSFVVQSKGFGLYLKHALGAVGVITTTAAGTNSRDHTHTLGDPFGLSYTFQKGVPDVSGTVQPFSYLGCKTTSWELSNSVDGYLMWKQSMFAQDETTGESLASASYPSGTVEDLFFSDGALNIASAAVSVSNVSISGNANLDTGRRFIRSSTLAKEPLIAGMYDISGSCTMEFESLTQYQRFTANTIGQLDVTWTAPTVIESTIYPLLTVTLPKVQFRGGTPTVTSAGVVQLETPFKVLYDGSTAPITILYRSADTTD
jgi:hypothetical protein